MNIIDEKYDVVILTHAPKDALVISIEKLLNQKNVPVNIIIYNTDENLFYKNISHESKLKKYVNNEHGYNTNIKLINIDKKDFDHGKSRNDASKLVSSKYILFMTDDAIPYDDNLTLNLIEVFYKYETNDKRVAVAYARQIASENATLKEKYVREFNYKEFDEIKEKDKESRLGIKNYFCSNVCAMYDREIFNSLGGFEENIILNEDTYFAYKCIKKGYRVIYVSNAKVYHSHNLNYREQFSRNFDIGVSQCQKKEIFGSVSSSKEGIKLICYVVGKLFIGLHFIKIVDFIIECFYRYLGFRCGLRYETYSIDKCISYANNKYYFIKRKNNSHV